MSEESSTSPIVVGCPKCSKQMIIEPKTTIAPQTQELDLLLTGNLNRFQCEACQTYFVYPTPLLYRDDKKRVLYYYIGRVPPQQINQVTQQLDTLYRTMFDDFSKEEKPICRLIFQRPHFIEKIKLLEFDLDDRLIEYVKYLLLQNVKELDIHRHELLFDFMYPPTSSIHFFVYDRKTHQPWSELNFPRHDWDQLHNIFLGTPEATRKLDTLFPPYRISVDEILGFNDSSEEVEGDTK